MSKIFDSHCHPQFPQYDADREEMIIRAKSSGVSMICVGTDFETSKSGIELAQKHDNMWATVGIHPNDLDGLVVNKVHGLVDLLSQQKVVAIGEIGLDYYRTEGEEAQKKQKDLFIQQLGLAKDFNLPVVLHCRDLPVGRQVENHSRAYSDMITILENCRKDLPKGEKSEIESSGRPWRAGVVHSCAATLDEAKQLLDLGFYFGFNGIITFPPSRSSFVKTSEGKKASEGRVPGMYDELVRYVPLDRILLETDAPYLTPEPHRGKRNEPSFVTLVVDKIAELKGVSRDEVVTQTTQNCTKLFKLA